ncbi:MAG: SusD/RagB family nutrient-binding outer membrane lipoprotein [Cytophagales bacterium]|nr:SusD/RagB family nutrient-binding outer membrane lipoprotein [Cytophagales bacterium]MCA6366949.1 SusD/RagB family nutrient-binding outer membrane lipoprotein [Cytophagales bacterium]MCA6371005.1 SusD/RagB family nutrient-binding outer membrane lipoprotein [Cytophagales bacterium]MCA6375422.1 SusD/RagB family nutrient-binding outer membrane lipoprotein [Cytophagales bacterium]MCA6382123.1 SusD/RagB family nutrient-binding outer membrane lipoprotein [Cytophagales bacterium]
MKRNYKVFIIAFSMLTASSCQLNLLDNPNQISTAQSGSNFIMNKIQVDFATFFEAISQFGMATTRMVHMSGENYTNAYQAANFDNTWSVAYTDLLVNMKDMKERAIKENLPYHAAMTKILEAYVLVSLVDYFGKVPYTEALNTSNFNPGVDDGAATYNRALQLLDEAIKDTHRVKSVNFNPPLAPTDLFYGPSISATTKESWRRLAGTLKLKILLQKRLVDASALGSINALVAEDSLIRTSSRDFQFIYPANSFDNPNNYHPWFFDNYQVGASQYMSNFFMDRVLFRTTSVDPRRRYYFYRQTGTTPTDPNILNCASAVAPPPHYPSGMAFCAVTANGYFGRDHLDPSGTPPDGLVRTIYGLYPAGGAFDNTGAADNQSGTRGRINSGARGRGILPIMLSSYTEFMIGEALLINNDVAGARARLNAGLTASFSKVTNFNISAMPATASAGSGLIPSATTVTNFINLILAKYDAAGSNDQKLDVLIGEYWISLFGNGVEAYNTYRRTGKPSNMQPSLSQNPGTFIRSFYYPSVFVNRNSNSTVSQKPTTGERVFWDTNPVNGFIN